MRIVHQPAAGEDLRMATQGDEQLLVDQQPAVV